MFALAPYRDRLHSVPSVLQSSIADDEKMKRIIASLTVILEKPSQSVSSEERAAPIKEASRQTPEAIYSEAVVQYLGKSHRKKGRGLLRFLGATLSWVPHTLEIKIANKFIGKSNIVDFTYLLLSLSQRL